MNINNDLKDLARIIMKLEDECQKGNNISKNLKQMELLMSGLSSTELMQLSEYLDDCYLQN